MSFRAHAALLAAALAAQAHADERVACPADRYVEATTLTALPEPVRVALARNGRGVIEVSDRGGPFNPTDIGAGPFRRFAVAATGISHLLVVVENGGLASNVDAWQFELGPDGWTGRHTAYLKQVPASAGELITAVCR